MFKQILFVGIGGGIGSILRFLISLLTTKIGLFVFPIATFIVNLLGCLAIGVLTGLSLKNTWLDTNMKVLFITGFCGGFTTFSTFSLENLKLYQTGNYQTFVLYISSSIIAGFIAVWTGYFIVTK